MNVVNLSALRQYKKMTCAEMATALEAGCKKRGLNKTILPNRISEWENGVRPVPEWANEILREIGIEEWRRVKGNDAFFARMIDSAFNCCYVASDFFSRQTTMVAAATISQRLQDIYLASSKFSITPIRTYFGMNFTVFGELLGEAAGKGPVPSPRVSEWEKGRRSMPEWVVPAMVKIVGAQCAKKSEEEAERIANQLLGPAGKAIIYLEQMAIAGKRVDAAIVQSLFAEISDVFLQMAKLIYLEGLDAETAAEKIQA